MVHCAYIGNWIGVVSVGGSNVQRCTSDLLGYKID